MVTKNYRLRVLSAGFEFEAEGDKAFVLDMLRRFDPRSQSIDTQLSDATENKRPTKGSARVAMAGTTKSLSIREFIHRLGLKKHTDLVVAFGYYLEKFEGKPNFSPADINNCYYEAKLETSNTSQMIINNIRRSYMMEAKSNVKGRKRYTLTNSGEKYVETKLAQVAA